ncbi:uncharacterized protein SPPG_08547 [Spizellomyces punctatus DAOM BR117]|uniref:Biogenesis of lysosome-related organelles complex 1 subunit 2 n=1 Tax=Spizellomyces punctatus (strain DAOM BR117) TaxID=645134 RepID=A0A0L0H5C1_SPIPD|nr:uncharacterized protein SPPG_08547 [Spizellomyces punctatus DAOM BR117]KNC96159.1 hypothetical protein SPPG_08547 [Spizellomyces punctatus DAOM BR117]|eukprot:XP_016604199.1 hypothetical protein SPPG_08547 [Spizellomyces punctatus DAOM BR117]
MHPRYNAIYARCARSRKPRPNPRRLQTMQSSGASSEAPPLPPRQASMGSTSPSFPPRSVSLPPDQSRLLGIAEAVAEDTLVKVAEAIRNDVTAAGDDLTVLQSMTALARDRYAEYNATAQELIAGMGKVQHTYAEMETYIDQIFDVERQVASIEQVVSELDDYTKRLEESLKRRK